MNAINPNTKEKIMKLEIVEFYPTDPIETPSGASLIGTLHIYFCDLKMDLRGLNVIRTKKGKLKVYLPCRRVRNEEKESIRLPYVNFTDQKTLKKVRNFLAKDCVGYVQKFLNEKEAEKEAEPV